MLSSPFTFHSIPQSPEVLLPILGLPSNSPPTIQLGVDIARFGSNHSVLFIGHQRWVIGGARWQGMDTFQSAAIIAAVVNEWEELGWICTYCCIDTIGVGGGTADNLWNSGGRFREIIKPINVSLRSSNQTRYFNARSEIAWNLRSDFRTHLLRLLSQSWLAKQAEQAKPAKAAEGGAVVPAELIRAVGLPQWLEAKLKKQCTTMKYENDESRMGGMIHVHSKETYAGDNDDESPDEFDALALLRNRTFVGLERRPAMSQIPKIFGR